MEFLPEVRGIHLLPNPRHPLFFTRQELPTPIPLPPRARSTILMVVTSGSASPHFKNATCPGSVMASISCSAMGSFVAASGMSPFHPMSTFLLGQWMGDVSPCGASGRWACGDSVIADLRSGDGWETCSPSLPTLFSSQCHVDSSEIYDADPKGSPDGTKIGFVSNYPLDTGPVTRITDVRR